MKTSVIIPVRTITPYVRETVSYLKKQTEKGFEILIITDEKENLAGATIIASGNPTPSFKRNLGAKMAKGKILAFLDDDSYPDKKWLEKALKVFEEELSIVGVCGPTLTPAADSIYQKASGWVWAIKLGSGGAGVYRNRIMERREVDDFPSVNLLVRKKNFWEVNGFDINHWPGEDTKLCLDLVQAGGRIIYEPGVLVYHHRRPVFLPHLKQISRYAKRRGYFARVFPQTSFRIGYLLPSLFTYGLIVGAVASLFSPLIRLSYSLLLIAYSILLFTSGIEVFIKEKNVYLSFLVMCSIFLTHLTYGFLLPIGYFQKDIKTVPHKIDRKKKVYLGG